MRKLLIWTGFAALALTVGGCEENVQIAGAQALTATSASLIADREVKGEVMIVYTNGEPDFCLVVEAGTDIPVSMALLQE